MDRESTTPAQSVSPTTQERSVSVPVPVGPILVLGAGGQLGRCMVLEAQARGIPVVGLTRADCDLADPARFRESLRAAIEGGAVAGGTVAGPAGSTATGQTPRPSHIINCAAYTAVDKAEVEQALALAVNGLSVSVLGEVAQAAQVPVIHFSTDYVFDGRRPLEQSYGPEDPTNPLSVYGQTKRVGEDLLLASGAQALVFRTSWVFSAQGSSFLRTMLRLAETRSELRVVDDQWGAPTSAEWLAEATLDVCQQWPNPDEQQHAPKAQIFHLTAAGQTNWRDYAALVLDGKGVRVEGVSTDEYAAGFKAAVVSAGKVAAPQAPRPKNSQLDCSATEAAFGIRRPNWEEQVQRVLTKLSRPRG